MTSIAPTDTTTQAPDPELAERAADHAAYIDGLRRIADFLEQHPDLPVAWIGERLTFVVNDAHGDPAAAQLAAVVRAMKATFGTVTKDPLGNYMTAEVYVGPHTLAVIAARDAVCERVVVGTQPVEVPDPAALAAVPKVTVEQEIVEWRCSPLLDRAGE